MDYSTFLKHKPEVKAFFHDQTNTITYVVADPKARECVVIDSVLDYDQPSGTISHESADEVLHYIQGKGYKVAWILETHVHADHLTAAAYLRDTLGGKVAIGKHIQDVQTIFTKAFNDNDTACDGSQFDMLWNDGDTFTVGGLPAVVIHTPGHTPADVVYVIGDAAFAGDTMFMPDFGTARCDFPGGSAETLYASAHKLFALPESMRMFMCHDYLPDGRDTYTWETTIAEQKKGNIQLNENVEKEAFVEFRTSQDKGLGMPRLIIPSLQVNIRAGRLPNPEDNNVVYLKTPINSVFSKDE